MEEGLRKENSRQIDERNSKFRDYDAMPILGIPNVVVVEPVHVHLELTVVVEVHVGHEELCDESSVSLPTLT